MNIQWLSEQLRLFLAVSEYRVWEADMFSGYTLVKPETEVIRQAQIVEQILDRVLTPAWREQAKAIADEKSARWWGHRESAERALAQLETQEQLDANLRDSAPQLDASTLHPWVWDGCKTLWDSGHYREAVNAAARVVSSQTQTKVGRRDTSDHDLIAQSFSTKPPEAGKPRLRLQAEDHSDTYKSRQEGAIALARGLYMGIRNPAAHEHHETELPENHALEQLAAFSILARWVDMAQVDRHA